MTFRRNLNLLLLGLGLVTIVVGTVAQDPCPTPVYAAGVRPWAAGTNVHFSFDATGQIGAPTNPQPAFTLNTDAQTAFANGMTAWNAHSINNGSDVTNRTDAYGNVLRLKAPCQVGNSTRFGYDVYFSAIPQRRPN